MKFPFVVFSFKILLKEYPFIFLKLLASEGRKLLSQGLLGFRISLEPYDLHVRIIFLLFHLLFFFPLKKSKIKYRKSVPWVLLGLTHSSVLSSW